MKSVLTDSIQTDWGPWLGMSPAGIDLMQSFVQRDPLKRITAAEALEHDWFLQQLGGLPEEDGFEPQESGLLLNNIVPIVPSGSFSTPASSRLRNAVRT